MDNLKQDLSYLQDWVFHFNSFTEQWAAIPRESYDQYWNDYKNTAVLRSKTLNTLLELLHKAKGSRNSRRLGNYYETMEQYPNLFQMHTALGAGGVRQVGSTLVISGQNPMDVMRAYLTGEIPTKMGQKYIK